MPAEEANRLAYKDMNTFYYVTGTLAMYMLIILGAIAIKDIAVIFNFVTAITGTAVQFLFPALFYRIAIKKFNVEKTYKVRRNLCLTWVYIVVGLINCLLSTFAAVIYIVGE